MNYRSRAIVLKNMDYQETDKLVTIFTEQEGKIRAIAKGIKKPGSTLRACIQPFCHSLLYLRPGRNLELVTQGRLKDFYGNLREDINGTLQAMYLMELLDKSLMDRVAMKPLFNTTVEVLEYLDLHGLNPLAIRYFELKLLIYLGYQPVLGQCVRCGQSVNNDREFDLAEGGVICATCSQNYTSRWITSLSGETLALLRLMMQRNLIAIDRVKASPTALRQMEWFTEKYMEYHLERRFVVKKTIRSMKTFLAGDG